MAPMMAYLLTGFLLFGSSFQAAESIGGTLTQGGPQGDPVPGVTLTVSDASGVVGSATSAADGSWEVPLPGPGTYRVDLDASTLPEGAALRDPGRSVLEGVEVRAGQHKSVVFALGERVVDTAGWFTRLSNLVAKGLTYGAIVALAAVGLSLVFGVTGLVNFAHGEVVTFGAVAAWYFNASGAGPGLHLLWAILPAVALAGLLGAGLERGLFRPLRRRRTGNVALIVVSIGLSLLVRHIYLILMGGAPRAYEQYAVQSQVSLGPIALPPKDLIIIAASLAVLAAVGLMLTRTRLGAAMRAVADNKDLAEASGISVDRIVLYTWALGAGLAGLGGIFLGITQTVQWDMGFVLLLIMFAAVVLGGIGTAYGAALGGLIIGVATETSTFWIPVEFKHVVSLGVLILVLMVRPQGIFGLKERIG
ncbi:MAG: High-affinity branched-chain amino acid transport system permease protein LivH [Acidobacteria bacterium]|nr:High-affinity branched-chain amino acid transport system permease protein LivH [Acidobacteriota bacterium]